jgi:hypothetical protein
VARWHPLAVTPAMLALLTFYAQSATARARQWKTRPRPNKAQKQALIRRGFVAADLVITDKGRAILKATRTAGPKAPPKKVKAAYG